MYGVLLLGVFVRDVVVVLVCVCVIALWTYECLGYWATLIDVLWCAGTAVVMKCIVLVFFCSGLFSGCT